MSRPFEKSDWHPVQTLRPVEWAMPRPGTRERFAVISHLRSESGWAFWVVTVVGDRLGPFDTLEDAAEGVHHHAVANSGAPPHTGYPTHNMEEAG